MLPERTSQTQRILYIVDAHVTGPDAVSLAVRGAGGVVERCSDVYEGLWRLGQGRGRGRTGSGAFAAVVLCLDYLAVDEYEFIALAKRSVPGIAVLVHGGAGSLGDVDRAMALGADRWVEGSAEALGNALVGVGVGVGQEGTAEEQRNKDAKRQAETSASSAPGTGGSVGGVEELIDDRSDWSGTGAEPLLSAGELSALAGVYGDGESDIDTDGGVR